MYRFYVPKKVCVQMTFRELSFKDNLDSFRGEDESFLQSMMANQSPIMKLWFGIMMLMVVLSLFTLAS